MGIQQDGFDKFYLSVKVRLLISIITVLLLGALLALFGFVAEANASDEHEHESPPSQNQPINIGVTTTATATAASAATVGSVSGGSNYTSINYPKQTPVASPSAAASSNTTADCRYLDQWAMSVFFINGSKTKMLRDLVCTLGAELNSFQKLALCIESGDYRQLRYYVSTLPPENGKPQEAACQVGETSRVMGK